MRGNKLQILAGVLMLAIIAGAILLPRLNGHNAAPEPDSDVPAEVLAAISTYEQAKENSVGADQPSPTSWLEKIKPVTTKVFWNSLQPVPSAATGGAPYDYTYAHQNNLVVKARVSGCYWSSVYSKPTASNGVVICSLGDTTLDHNTGREVPASSLQYGWTRTGKQMPSKLLLEKQAGKWLIGGDSTGQGY
jgi:hypothetical protein